VVVFVAVSRVLSTFADGGQTGPLMIVLQPFDVSADRGRAGLDAAVIGLDVGRPRAREGGLAVVVLLAGSSK
jgi:hypothetical protein